MDFQKILNQNSGKPQNILKIVIGISAVMLVLWLLLVSKIDTGNISQSQQPEVQERTEGLRNALLNANEEQTGYVPSEREKPDMFQNAFITFIIMIGLLGGAWFWVKRKGFQPRQDTFNREIGEQILGPGAHLKFLHINDEVWVVGITNAAVNLLHKYSKEEWIESELADRTQTKEVPAPKNDFKSIYKFFSN